MLRICYYYNIFGMHEEKVGLYCARTGIVIASNGYQKLSVVDDL